MLENFHLAAKDNYIALNVYTMQTFSDKMFAVKQYMECFTTEHGILLNDVQARDIVAEMEGGCLIGEKSSSTYFRYARVEKTILQHGNI